MAKKKINKLELGIYFSEQLNEIVIKADNGKVTLIEIKERIPITGIDNSFEQIEKEKVINKLTSLL